MGVITCARGKVIVIKACTAHNHDNLSHAPVTMGRYLIASICGSQESIYINIENCEFFLYLQLININIRIIQL